jgi:hypothetical protein
MGNSKRHQKTPDKEQDNVYREASNTATRLEHVAKTVASTLLLASKTRSVAQKQILGGRCGCGSCPIRSKDCSSSSTSCLCSRMTAIAKQQCTMLGRPFSAGHSIVWQRSVCQDSGKTATAWRRSLASGTTSTNTNTTITNTTITNTSAPLEIVRRWSPHNGRGRRRGRGGGRG